MVLFKSPAVDCAGVFKLEESELAGVSVTKVAFAFFSEVIKLFVVVVSIFVINVVILLVVAILREDAPRIGDERSEKEPWGSEVAMEDFFEVLVSLIGEDIEPLTDIGGNVSKLLSVAVNEAGPSVTRLEVMKVSVDDKTSALVKNTCLLTLLVVIGDKVMKSFSEDTLIVLAGE